MLVCPTKIQDRALIDAVERYGAKSWKKIAELVPDRTDVQCLHRWQKVLNPELVKGPWTPEVRSPPNSLASGAAFVLVRFSVLGRR